VSEEEKMDYCIVCKNLTERRYKLELNDSKISVGIKAHVCRDCFNRFLSSHSNQGIFRISKFLGWVKGKDRIRE
jgi:hypothetical protein